MRRLVVAVIAIVAGIAGTGWIARAEPPPAPAVPPAPEPPAQFYLELGGAFGLGVGVYAAGAGELGYRPGGGSLSIHAVIQDGSVVLYGPFDAHVASSGYFALRAGVEERGCVRHGVWCAFASADIGYLHQYATTTSEPPHEDHRVAIIVPRIGLDAGGGVLRVRVGFETSLSRQSWETRGMTAGIAFNW